MREAEQRRQPYLFKLRMTKGVKRAIERAMGEHEWQDAGAGWQGKDGRLRLEGWSRHRRIVILRRRVERTPALAGRDAGGQLRLGFAAIDGGGEAWEYVWPRWRGGEGLGVGALLDTFKRGACACLFRYFSQ